MMGNFEDQVRQISQDARDEERRRIKQEAEKITQFGDEKKRREQRAAVLTAEIPGALVSAAAASEGRLTYLGASVGGLAGTTWELRWNGVDERTLRLSVTHDHKVLHEVAVGKKRPIQRLTDSLTFDVEQTVIEFLKTREF